MDRRWALVAGIGNIWLGDDAFGIHVARRILSSPPIQGVRTVDFSMRWMDLALTLGEGYEIAIVIHAGNLAHAPGTLEVHDLQPSMAPALPGVLGPLKLNPARILQQSISMGAALPRRVLSLNCQPTVLGGREVVGLSSVVRAAIPAAVERIRSLIAEAVDPVELRR